MTEPLSPVAQSVLDAVASQMEGGWISPEFIPYEARKIAAALRTAADQVVPQPPKNWDLISPVAARECEIRKNLIAIAAELEGGND